MHTYTHIHIQQSKEKVIGKNGIPPTVGMTVRLKGNQNRGEISEVAAGSVAVNWDAGDTQKYPLDGDVCLILVEEGNKDK
jgi:hypothetical protein